MTPEPAQVQQLGLGAYALRYQQLGFAVLGLGFTSKRPHPEFRHGVDWATADPAMVPWLWSRHKMSGVGIATGQRSRLLVVDLDVKADEDGPGEFGQWLLTTPGIPLDVISSTPSGGWHIWLRTPPGVMVPSRLGILPGVDIKGDGGYVVAPPTQVMVDSPEGQARLPYRWAAGCPCSVPPLPEWFGVWASTAVGTGRAAVEGGGGEPVDYERLCAEGLPMGSRNIELHRAACGLFRKYGTTPDGITQVREAIKPVLAKTDRRGFGPAEVERTLMSARRFVAESDARATEAWESWH